MPVLADDPAPCAVESKLWRECLKEFDYGPDRPKGACEKQRDGFYGCIKDWNNRTQVIPYSYKKFEVSQECRHEAEMLHQCMMMNMFEVSHCQKEMTLMKRCAAQHDPEVRRSLEGDPAVAELQNRVDYATGWRRLWYKAIVWGSRGWIGGQVMAIITARGHTAIAASSRADNEVDVAKELDEVQPDRAICLVGRTRGGDYLTIDYLEQPGKLVENMRDNMWAPVVLSAQCGRRSVHLTYLGTGCIFHYDDAHPADDGKGFTEADAPNFFGSSYSTVKGYTDRMMHLLFDESVLNCRIRMPITADDSPYNFITKIANYDRVINVPNSMTVLPELIPVMLRLAEQKVTGTVNLTNPGCISHNEILDLYRKYVDSGYTYTNFTIAEQNSILASARSNNLLDSTRLLQLAPEVPEIHEAVERICQEIARRYPEGIVKRRAKEKTTTT